MSGRTGVVPEPNKGREGLALAGGRERMAEPCEVWIVHGLRLPPVRHCLPCALIANAQHTPRGRGAPHGARGRGRIPTTPRARRARPRAGPRPRRGLDGLDRGQDLDHAEGSTTGRTSTTPRARRARPRAGPRPRRGLDHGQDLDHAEGSTGSTTGRTSTTPRARRARRHPPTMKTTTTPERGNRGPERGNETLPPAVETPSVETLKDRKVHFSPVFLALTLPKTLLHFTYRW
jgi:hypothetical protein